MNICIIGWYGSETLGDRAILDGIIHIFSGIDKELLISIGSLYPVLTERTIFEDLDFYLRHSERINVKCFDVKDRAELHSNIKESDIVLMGGGPLMDLVDLYIIQHSFKYAKKNGIATALMGCGYGPLERKEYIKCVGEIVHYSDIVIMRSKRCKDRIVKVCREQDREKIHSFMDPAEISVIEYGTRCKKFQQTGEKNGWIMNVRDLNYVYGDEFYNSTIEEDCVRSVLGQVNKLTLMPMHTFSVGGDDREIQSRIAQTVKASNLSVIQRPLCLKEAYDMVKNAEGCIGMRYHSIVFQTYLNGNNYMIDYTNPESGKIRAFIDTFDVDKFYTDRYYNVFQMNSGRILINKNGKKYMYESSVAEESVNLYRNLLKTVLRD